MYKTEIKTLQLKDLTSFPENPQEVPADKMEKIAKAMKSRGWYGELCLCWENEGKTYVISGNHRVECALNAGIEESRCIVIQDDSYTWEQARKDCIAFNTLHGDPDEEKLKDFIETLVDDLDLDIESMAVDIGMDEIEIKDALDIMNFDPVSIDEQPRLDEKSKSICPECGCEF